MATHGRVRAGAERIRRRLLALVAKTARTRLFSRRSHLLKVQDSGQAECTVETAYYDYQDATGEVVFQVVRYHPKDFRQCRLVDGRRVWNMDGVERVPYRLPELLGSPASVWIVEGEKDVETLRAINQTATCNPGGAGNWLPAYSQYLRDQYVYLVPDNDEPGQKHSRAVLASLAGLVEWVKWLQLPRESNGRPVKDVTDLREACGWTTPFPNSWRSCRRQRG